MNYTMTSRSRARTQIVPPQDVLDNQVIFFHFVLYEPSSWSFSCYVVCQKTLQLGSRSYINQQRASGMITS